MNTRDYKNIVIGIVIGGLLTCSIGAIADNIYSVTENPYPITINGKAKSIEGYNIDGSTYFKLRDIGKQVGFEVGFNEGVISITTQESIVNDSVTNENTVTNTEIDMSSLKYLTIDEVEYVKVEDLDTYIGYRHDWLLSCGDDWCSIRRDGKLPSGDYGILEEYKLDTIMKDGVQYISKETIEKEILPRITGETK